MSLEGDPDEVHTSIDDHQRPSHVVVTAVAAVTGRKPAACPPLFDAVDPDALDAIFDDRQAGLVAFEYGGCDVRVRGDTVSVEPR